MKAKLVKLIITGGLGNQLFQYACARCIQLKLDSELVINTSLYRFDTHGRNYSLQYFNIPENVKIEENKKLLIKLIGKLSDYMPNIVYWLCSMFGIYIWKKRTYKNIQCSKDENYLLGYFQSEMYFYEIREIIKKELKVKESLISNNKQYIDSVSKCNSVCVHVRRGDYVTEGHLVCDKIYYSKAISYIRANTSNPQFYIFSDEISWAKNNILGNDIFYVDNNYTDYEELSIMYSCKHFIISNSSFSWWAQYLSDNENKIVVAPSIWDLGEKTKNDIYLSNWIVI